jgi:hypothetical protein
MGRFQVASSATALSARAWRHSTIDFDTKVTNANKANKEATAKACHRLVFVVQNLHMQRHGVGLTPYMP